MKAFMILSVVVFLSTPAWGDLTTSYDGDNSENKVLRDDWANNAAREDAQRQYDDKQNQEEEEQRDFDKSMEQSDGRLSWGDRTNDSE